MLKVKCDGDKVGPKKVNISGISDLLSFQVLLGHLFE